LGTIRETRRACAREAHVAPRRHPSTPPVHAALHVNRHPSTSPLPHQNVPLRSPALPHPTTPRQIRRPGLDGGCVGRTSHRASLSASARGRRALWGRGQGRTVLGVEQALCARVCRRAQLLLLPIERRPAVDDPRMGAALCAPDPNPGPSPRPSPSPSPGWAPRFVRLTLTLAPLRRASCAHRPARSPYRRPTHAPQSTRPRPRTGVRGLCPCPCMCMFIECDGTCTLWTWWRPWRCA
jgi:hypothetical protein